MALTTSTIAEVEGSGDDTNFSGLFDPTQTAGMFTDGATTNGTNAAPVFTSASYLFVAGDAGAWVYIALGTSWVPGWYKISSVNVGTGAATLNATIGQAVLKAGIVTTAVGVGSSASLSGATWTIDYSQQTAAKNTYLDLLSAGTGLTVSSSAKPFGRQQVGNGIVITGGTNFNLGRYVIASVAAVTFVATVVGPTNITTGAGALGTGGLGGCFATLAKALSIGINASNTAWNRIFITGTGFTTAANIAANIQQTEIIGYGTVRGDNTKAVITATAGCTQVIAQSAIGVRLRNLTLDAASIATNCVGSTANEIELGSCWLKGATGFGFTTSSSGAKLYDTEISGCVGGATSIQYLHGCSIHDNTGTGVVLPNGGSVQNCLIANNTGATSDGVSATFDETVVNCTIHGNGRDGIRHTNTYLAAMLIRNNILTSNGFSAAGYGINYSGGTTVMYAFSIDKNAYFGNMTGAVLGIIQGVNDVLLGSSPYVASGSNNFQLTPLAISLLAGIPGAFPGLASTTGYLFIGAVQPAISLAGDESSVMMMSGGSEWNCPVFIGG